MDLSHNSIVVAIKAIVYTVLIAVGSMILLADPTAMLGAVPVGVGLLLLLHSVYQGNLRRIEYTILGLYVVVLGILAITTATSAIAFDLPGLVTSDVVLSLLLTVVLIAIYVGQLRSMNGSNTSPQ